MKFLKENSYDIVKLYINQIGIAIFSMALYSAIEIALPSDFRWGTELEAIISALAILFYCSLIYVATWEFGAKDRIKIDGGRMTRKPYKGLLIGTLANVPNFILTGIALICMGIFFASGAEGFKAVFSILNLLFGLLESMYLGIIIAVFPLAEANADWIHFYRTIAYFAMPLIPIAVSHLGYALGERNFRIASIFSQKSAQNSKK